MAQPASLLDTQALTLAQAPEWKSAFNTITRRDWADSGSVSTDLKLSGFIADEELRVTISCSQ